MAVKIRENCVPMKIRGFLQPGNSLTDTARVSALDFAQSTPSP